MVAKVKIEDLQGKHHFASMFAKVILTFTGNKEGNVTELLQNPQIHVVFTVEMSLLRFWLNIAPTRRETPALLLCRLMMTVRQSHGTKSQMWSEY